jgi:Ca-activated chloride channel family protein
MRTPLFLFVTFFLTPLFAAQAPGTLRPPSPPAPRAWSANVVLPQARAFHVDPSAPAVGVTRVRADIEIVDGVATTTLDVSLENPGERDAEAELLLPVPDGAVVSGYDFEGKSPTSTAVVLGRDEAKSTYRSIVSRIKDPALLEFAGATLVRSSVFPVTRHGRQTVRVRYEHVLPVEDSRWDYVLPRSESLAGTVPWEIDVAVRSKAAIANVYSPTHDLPRIQGDAHHVKLHARPGAPVEAGPLRISVLLGDGPLSTTLFTSADANGEGGWFMLLAGLGDASARLALPPREVTLVLDRSGSMAGPKFDQARAAALQVLEGLAFGEAIQIIDYSDTVERFAPEPVVKTKESLPQLRAYLARLATNGGTNIEGALSAALSTPVAPGRFPVVLFLTDGLATVGETREGALRARIEAANVHKRRVFTFGVGNDVNATLLDAVAVESRARATYVRPEENVELAVSSVFKDLEGPTITDLTVNVKNGNGAADTRILRDVYPRVLPDLYRDDRLLLVGRYTAAERVRIELGGNRAGVPSTWTLDYDLARALPRNEFVRRLWAMRRIAALEDDLRRAGAEPSALVALKDDPRFGETAREMLDLATRFGVLTGSTAFLALEGTALGNADALLAQAADTALHNASQRSGINAVAAQQNVGIQCGQAWMNNANCLYDANGAMTTSTTVQTIQGRTFFRRGARWVDGSIALNEKAVAPDREIVFGSAEHTALVERLRAEGRAGQLSLDGEILIRDGAETILVRPANSSPAADAPKPAARTQAPNEDDDC